MKIKQGQAVPIRECTRKGKWIMASRTNDLLVLDCYEDKEYKGRYLMNVSTGEYGILRENVYHMEKMIRAFETSAYWGYSTYSQIKCSSNDEKIIRTALKSRTKYETEIPYLIEEIESSYASDIRERKEMRREERLRNLMNTIPDLPEGFRDWVRKVTWKAPYPVYKNGDGEFICPHCQKKISAEKLKQGKKNIPHNGTFMCDCKKELQIKRRGKSTGTWEQVILFQETTEGKAAYRCFDVKIMFSEKGHRIRLNEAWRMLLGKEKKTLNIYYNQNGREYNYEDFDRRNPSNRQFKESFLYPKGVENLNGTGYEKVIRLFTQMAQSGIRADYNGIMAAKEITGALGLVEYLFKGRFWKLLEEETKNLWSRGYFGDLNIRGTTIEEVMRIKDRQRINRLRQRNGGGLEREWLSWSDENGKLSDAFLDFARDERISLERIKFILDRMTPEQVMHYIKRQQQESYKEKTVATVLNQWKDYLRMCVKLGKDVTDALTYRPRDLKRRHNEAVEAIRKINMIEEMKRDLEAKKRRAKELREKYPGAEEILAEIAPRYEYENAKYKIIVPQHLTDIMSEGTALHHCVGSTDRYFERIRDQETYICFLRRQEEPDVPFYTIEVEPGGTIRQHRGMYDEEPNIEEIRGFLREWQRVLKKRLHSKDWRLAEESRIKRERNLEQLRKANNERVLKGLAEDFMEAV